MSGHLRYQRSLPGEDMFSFLHVVMRDSKTMLSLEMWLMPASLLSQRRNLPSWCLRVTAVPDFHTFCPHSSWACSNTSDSRIQWKQNKSACVCERGEERNMQCRVWHIVPVVLLLFPAPRCAVYLCAHAFLSCFMRLREYLRSDKWSENSFYMPTHPPQLPCLEIRFFWSTTVSK